MYKKSILFRRFYQERLVMIEVDKAYVEIATLRKEVTLLSYLFTCLLIFYRLCT